MPTADCECSASVGSSSLRSPLALTAMAGCDRRSTVSHRPTTSFGTRSILLSTSTSRFSALDRIASSKVGWMRDDTGSLASSTCNRTSAVSTTFLSSLRYARRDCCPAATEPSLRFVSFCRFICCSMPPVLAWNAAWSCLACAMSSSTVRAEPPSAWWSRSSWRFSRRCCLAFSSFCCSRSRVRWISLSRSCLNGHELGMPGSFFLLRWGLVMPFLASRLASFLRLRPVSAMRFWILYLSLSVVRLDLPFFLTMLSVSVGCGIGV
mmetsp:Transcript_21067/g.60097  ORF Transcript_21067/g.60097 Transcript_21067/m.60097 type:complete len:265 (+) Transcript_21067:922-1716(+)